MTNDMSTSSDYDALADRAERGELRPVGRPKRGEAAAEEGRRMMMEATGAKTWEEAVALVLGSRR